MAQPRREQEPLREIERELMLISRHSLAAQPVGFSRVLDRSAYHLLSRMQVQGPMSIGQLAEAFGLDTSTVNRQTSAMLRAHLVERIADPEGGIARKLRITALGAEQLAADRAGALDALGRVLADWQPRELAELRETLERFNTSVERHEGRPWPRARD
ncbi:MarR family winged helix-turn-helix transcriptional regulator [Kitasatospora nipponensis]|uniref:MarR family winged helix-turn-helix transcriptional regulator n=1 Tax=Kitasatospora nipponensis TaxID=258049 RepID=A0ABN1WV03_9ACTN